MTLTQQSKFTRLIIIIIIMIIITIKIITIIMTRGPTFAKDF